MPVSGNFSHENTFSPKDTDNGIKGAKNYECVFPFRCGGRVCTKVHTASSDCFLSFTETFRITEVLYFLQLIRVVLRYSHICLKKLQKVFLKQ